MSHIDTSWLQTFFALFTSARESRGSIEVKPFITDQASWPRTTCGDVIAIAAVIDPHVQYLPDRFGAAGVSAQWRARLDEIERLALHDADEIYPANRAFWRTLHMVCIFMSSLERRSPDATALAALIHQLDEPIALRNVGPKGDGPFRHFDAKTYSDLYLEQFKHLRDLRGFDNKDPEPGMTGVKKVIPRTTNSDVVALADYWSKQLDAVKKVFGHEGVERRWNAALAPINTIARPGDPYAVYPKNNGFWRDLQGTAIHVSVADESPSKGDLMLDSLKDSLKGLPESIQAGVNAVGKGAVSLASDIANGAGKIANEAGKGLFSGAGMPLLVGAGLVGMFLIARNRSKTEQE